VQVFFYKHFFLTKVFFYKHVCAILLEKLSMCG